MVAMILYMKKETEQTYLKKLSKDATAYFSEEVLDLKSIGNAEDVMRYLNQVQILDLACMDVTNADDIYLLKKIREQYGQSEIFLIADREISPMKYLTPDIRAASLLLRPYKEKQCQQVVQDFFRSFYRSRENLEEKKIFVMENQEGKTLIPFEQIYYIEVRERKVFIRLKNKEYSRYDSLEHILKSFPNTFLQCHRSFAFNTERFDSVKLSENTICLENDIMVPLSRSYKPAIKEFLHGLQRI